MNSKLITYALSAFLAFGMSKLSFSNNLVISSVTLTNDSTLTFSVSWENSWRTNNAPYNHDAVWLFVKKRDCASLQWSHVNLSPTTTSHSTSSPLEIYIDGRDGSTSAKGIFVRRGAAGAGNISSVNVSVRMQGVTNGQYDFKVFGIETVQIPQGAFQVGDGISTGTFKNGTSTDPFTISSESALTTGNVLGRLHSSATATNPDNLPANFPKGFREIYCMKYEISQGQYVDFVNTLLSDQGAARQIAGTTNRLGITGTWPVLVATVPHRAMNHLSWTDFLAYLDWSALRPMTELEYEKIARGPVTPVAGEYAWGSSLITDANTLVGDGTATENSSTAITAGSGLANLGNNVVLGPLRCGFAAKPGTNRLESGAGYYGVMELSGNVWELVVTTANAQGVAFNGSLGDGELSVSPSIGFANAATWPSPTAVINGTATAIGAGLRGGSWNDAAAQLRSSDRNNALYSTNGRNTTIGGRGVR